MRDITKIPRREWTTHEFDCHSYLITCMTSHRQSIVDKIIIGEKSAIVNFTGGSEWKFSLTEDGWDLVDYQN